MAEYVDIQVNGHFGIDFNSDDLNAEQMHFVCQRMQELGVARFLPTIITDSIEAMCRRIDRLVRLRDEVAIFQQMFEGIHVEGPFISREKGYVGAHPVEHACDASLDKAKQIIEAGAGCVRLFTLAPECDSPNCEVTRWLVDQRIRVAAGHTDASLSQLQAAIQSGLTGFTHLGNGCPLQLHRHDNIVQRVFHLRNELWVSLIADGAHLPTWVLRNFVDILGLERTIVVTDAISAAGFGPGLYRLGQREVRIGQDGVPRSADNSHFIGSAATMPVCDQTLRSIGLSDAERHQLLCVNPSMYLRDR
jgi:N-acetylglucosamine-6-phosphate deacetylase